MSPVDVKAPEEASVTTLVTGIIEDAQRLAKQQYELFKHDVRMEFRKTRDAAMAMGGGAILLFVGVVLLALTLVQLLNWAVPTLPLWACYAIVGVIFAIVGVGMVYAGKHKADTVNPAADESVQALKETLQWTTNRK
jgi:sterol desaturase/sphingolipid hydroxylase (fatty acid hydroxylase superfamily)